MKKLSDPLIDRSDDGYIVGDIIYSGEVPISGMPLPIYVD